MIPSSARAAPPSATPPPRPSTRHAPSRAAYITVDAWSVAPLRGPLARGREALHPQERPGPVGLHRHSPSGRGGWLDPHRGPATGQLAPHRLA